MSTATSVAAAIARRTLGFAALACVALFAAGSATAQSADALAARHAVWQRTVARDLAGPDLAITSDASTERMRGDIDGMLRSPFATLAARLASPSDWCEIALLHLNVKSCTHEVGAGGDTVTFYSGSKRFETPDRAYALRYRFRVEAMRADYIAVVLTAATGPFDTRDYAIIVEAMPAGTQSFVHLSYAYRPSAASRFATSAYLATSGSGKKGFSVVGQDRDGNPSYVGGVRGVVERNAVRNFFAIEAFLDGCDMPLPRRVSHALERWYELTERYPAQLHELERSEYLSVKRQEYRQQVALQRAIDEGDTAER